MHEHDDVLFVGIDWRTDEVLAKSLPTSLLLVGVPKKTPTRTIDAFITKTMGVETNSYTAYSLSLYAHNGRLKVNPTVLVWNE